jgi:hypothetical protein
MCYLMCGHYKSLLISVIVFILSIAYPGGIWNEHNDKINSITIRTSTDCRDLWTKSGANTNTNRARSEISPNKEIFLWKKWKGLKCGKKAKRNAKILCAKIDKIPCKKINIWFSHFRHFPSFSLSFYRIF